MLQTGHRSSSGVESDADSENLPPIPVQGNDSLGSPYENVRPGDDLSSVEGTSPTQWQFYHKPRDDDRRVSGTSLWVSSLFSPSFLSFFFTLARFRCLPRFFFFWLFCRSNVSQNFFATVRLRSQLWYNNNCAISARNSLLDLLSWLRSGECKETELGIW